MENQQSEQGLLKALQGLTPKMHINIREVENGFIIQTEHPRKEYIAETHKGVCEIVNSFIEEQEQARRESQKGDYK